MRRSQYLNWQIMTSHEGAVPSIYSEYILNDFGIFVKRVRRVSKKRFLHALTGFRVGLTPVTGTDYREGPLDRNAILWRKLTSVTLSGENEITVTGNQSDRIIMLTPPEKINEVQNFINQMREANPLRIEPDEEAAAWICWRDDDEWDEPLMPLAEMIRTEQETERYIDPDVLEETRLKL